MKILALLLLLCYIIPILKNEEEFWADDDKPSVNEVTDVPDNFKESGTNVATVAIKIRKCTE